jgi:hypothetical protein
MKIDWERLIYLERAVEKRRGCTMPIPSKVPHDHPAQPPHTGGKRGIVPGFWTAGGGCFRVVDLLPCMEGGNNDNALSLFTYV